MDSETDRFFGQSTLTQASALRQQKQLSNPNDALIAQREREIEDIATGIIELANIFQELQTMVIDQGTLLDRIDYNVERTVEDVKGAEKELKVATNYQRRSVKRKIMLLLVICIVGLIILLSLKLGSRGGDKGGGEAKPPPENAIPSPPAKPDGEVHPDNAAPFADSRRVVAESGGLERQRRDWRRRRRRRAERGDV
jgi:syntaxin 16